MPGQASRTHLSKLSTAQSVAYLKVVCALHIIKMRNVNADGSAASYNVSECSHATFRRAAESFARSANFAPGANEEVHELTISWQPVN